MFDLLIGEFVNDIGGVASKQAEIEKRKIQAAQYANYNRSLGIPIDYNARSEFEKSVGRERPDMILIFVVFIFFFFFTIIKNLSLWVHYLAE